jgi:hypothetical protein
MNRTMSTLVTIAARSHELLGKCYLIYSGCMLEKLELNFRKIMIWCVEPTLDIHEYIHRKTFEVTEYIDYRTNVQFKLRNKLFDLVRKTLM